MDAVSFSGSRHGGVLALHQRQSLPPADSGPAAFAPATPTVSPPVRDVVKAGDTPDESGSDFGILYTANGLPEQAAAPAYTVPPAEAATNERVASGRNPSARLAMESSQLNALLSTLMTPANAARSSDQSAAPASAESTDDQLSRIARQSVVTQLYSQF